MGSISDANGFQIPTLTFRFFNIKKMAADGRKRAMHNGQYWVFKSLSLPMCTCINTKTRFEILQVQTLVECADGADLSNRKFPWRTFSYPLYSSAHPVHLEIIFEERTIDVNMPGYQIANPDRAKIDDKYFCTFCKLLLREAMQTSCGHFYCQSCLGNLFQ